jgi:hypothetical protein
MIRGRMLLAVTVLALAGCDSGQPAKRSLVTTSSSTTPEPYVNVPAATLGSPVQAVRAAISRVSGETYGPTINPDTGQEQDNFGRCEVVGTKVDMIALSFVMPPGSTSPRYSALEYVASTACCGPLNDATALAAARQFLPPDAVQATTPDGTTYFTSVALAKALPAAEFGPTCSGTHLDPVGSAQIGARALGGNESWFAQVGLPCSASASTSTNPP